MEAYSHLTVTNLQTRNDSGSLFVPREARSIARRRWYPAAGIPPLVSAGCFVSIVCLDLLLRFLKHFVCWCVLGGFVRLRTYYRRAQKYGNRVLIFIDSGVWVSVWVSVWV